MPADMNSVLKYFSYAFTIHLAWSDTHLSRHNLFGPCNDVITDFDYIYMFFIYLFTIFIYSINTFMIKLNIKI